MRDRIVRGEGTHVDPVPRTMSGEGDSR